MKKYIYRGIYVSAGVFLTIGVQALMSLHVPITIEYGKTYTVKKGFYKECIGVSESLSEDGKEVLFNPLICMKEDKKDSVFIIDYRYIKVGDL